jgi:ATP-dependent RNA helicase DeaD
MNEEIVETESVTTRPFVDLDLPQNLIDALSKNNITIATPVQTATIPGVTTGRDLIVQAQTGSGKTLAYVLPLLARLATLPEISSTYALIVTPTRELATQVREVFKSLTDEVRPACLIGGASSRDQIDDLGEDKRVIVGTPGRILDMIRRRAIFLRSCRYFVLDEADEMLSLGFLEDVRAILSRLPDKRQGLFISATITPRVQMLAQSFLDNPKTLSIKGSEQTPQAIEHVYCDVGGGVTEKAVALCDLIETERPQSVIIFCNTKSDTELVEVYLRRRGFDARRLNSDLSQSQREKIMGALRSGELKILIATDIAARGIDIDLIDLVINYSLHDQHETYVHRTGRTGRAGRSGKAISLIGPQDFTAFINLKRNVPVELKKMNLPSDEEVRLAKLAHFYEMVRQSGTPATPKEVDIAKGLLKELGDISEPTEELTQMIAKLYSLSLSSINASLEKAAREKAAKENIAAEGERYSSERPHREESSGRSSDSDSRRHSSDRSRGGGGYREERGRRGSDRDRGSDRRGGRR